MSKYVKMIQNASPRCTDLGISWQACTTTCKTGYTPSQKKLDCYAQVLTPRIFECLEDPCPIPFAKNQEGSGCLGVPGRVDGTVIESGETCRTECQEGFLSFLPTNSIISSHFFSFLAHCQAVSVFLRLLNSNQGLSVHCIILYRHTPREPKTYKNVGRK